MKLFASISSNRQLNELLDIVDGIVIGNNNFSALVSNNTSINDLISFIKTSLDNKKEVVLNICAMYDNDLINKLEDFIKNFLEYDIIYLYSDLGVYNLLKKYNLVHKGIYDPLTMITNSFDLNFYLNKGMLACGLSLEIPLSDVVHINDLAQGSVWYKVFGYHQMFYSKRHLISTYSKFINKEINLDKPSYLKEETRQEHYPIVENEHGTLLFRNYVINMIKELSKLKKIDYLYMDGNLLDEDIYIKSVLIYHKALNDYITKEEAILALNELELLYNDGFMYKDTVYQKEEL